MKKKHKNKKWFLKVRGSYLPNSRAGWLTYIPFLAWLLLVVWIAADNTDNIGMTVLIIVPNWIAGAIVMTYIASQKSS